MKMKLILHSDDINLLNYWEKSFKQKYTIIDELDELKNSKGNIIVINYSAFNLTQAKTIKLLNEGLNLVLVLHRVPNIDTAREVLQYGAKGYGNALMKDHFLLSAIETIKEKMIWLHPEFVSQLIVQIPTTENKDNSMITSQLSDREMEVSTLLKDGDSYKVIAQKLNITPRTVKAHAQKIYAKLHVKDRISLALLLK